MQFPWINKSLMYTIPIRYFKNADNKKLYNEAKISTSDDELYKKIVIKNFKTEVGDDSPNIIDIDIETGQVRQISKDHDSFNLKNLNQTASVNLI